MRLFRKADREERAEVEQRASSYTDLVIQEATADVSGTGADPRQLASVQAAAGAWGRGFAAAQVRGGGRRVAFAGASWLHELGRTLLLAGEAVYLLSVEDGEVRARRASDWDVHGVNEPWRYRLTFSGPDGTLVNRARSESVLHFMLNASPQAPHQGRSPFALSSLTADTAAYAEKQLRNEARSNHGRLIPAPIDGLSTEDLDSLKADVQSLTGVARLVPSFARGLGSGALPSGASDWAIRRLFMEPAETVVALRRDLAAEVLAVAGVPAELLLGGASATATRELLEAVHERLPDACRAYRGGGAHREARRLR